MAIRRRVTVIGVIAVMALGAGAYVSAWRVLGVVVTPVNASRSEIVQTIVASGKVESPSRVNLASQILGTVGAVFVNEGDGVAAGDILLSLDDSDAVAALDLAKAMLSQSETRLKQYADEIAPAAEQSLAVARATLISTQRTLDSTVTLAEKAFASLSALDDAQRARDIAAANVRIAELNLASASAGGGGIALAAAAVSQARASVASAGIRLRMTSITAPTKGVVIARTAEPGMVVSPGTALITLAPEGEKRLLIQVDERNLSLIALDQTAVASADAYPEDQFAARLSFINPAVDPARGSVEVKLTVIDPPAYLKEDMSVSVDIEVLRHQNALVLPLAAVRDAAGASPHVLTAKAGYAVDVPVKLGARGDGDVEILSGITEADPVILATDTAIVAGAKLRIAPSAAVTP